MMLGALWCFQQGYDQRMSSIDLLVGWGGSSMTVAWVINLLCPSGNLSPGYHFIISLCCAIETPISASSFQTVGMAFISGP